MILGQDRTVEQFAEAWRSRKLHHAWLLAGLLCLAAALGALVTIAMTGAITGGSP